MIPPRSRIITALLLVVGLTGCATLVSGQRELRQTDELVEAAEAQAESGDVDGAIAAVESALAANGRPETVYRLEYTLGWLYGQKHDAGGEASPSGLTPLEESIAHYELALEVVRDEEGVARGGRDACEALAGRLVEKGDLDRAILALLSIADEELDAEARVERTLRIGDIRGLSAGDDLDPDLAVSTAPAEYWEVYDDETPELDRWRDTAANRILLFHARHSGGPPPTWEVPLVEAAERFSVDDRPHLARKAYEILIPICLARELHESAQLYLQKWLDIEVLNQVFTTDSLTSLPGPAEWPNESLRELSRFAHDPVSFAPMLRYWLGCRTRTDDDPAGTGERVDDEAVSVEERLERQRLIARTAQALAANAARNGDFERAADTYRVALDENLAPALENYIDGPLAGTNERVVRLDVAIDLAVLMHEQNPEALDARNLLDFRSSIYGGKTPVIERDADAGLLRELERLHTVLGLIHVELGKWDVTRDDTDLDAWNTAPYHLRRAIELAKAAAKASGEAVDEHPLPHLSKILADGLKKHDRQGAFRAYLDAAVGFHAEDATGAATDSYDRAARLGRKLELENLGAVRDTRRDIGLGRGGLLPRQWIETGWFAGVTLHAMDASVDDGALSQKLNKTHSGIDVRSDDTDVGGKIWAGYQFDAPVAVEAGYVLLGETSSDLGTAVVPAGGDVQALLEDAANALPRTGEGLFAAVRVNLFGYGRLTVTGKVGVWAWDSDVKVTATEPGPVTTSKKFRADGVDPILGLGLLGEINEELRVRAEYEVYYLNQDPVQALAIGIEWTFSRR